MVSLKKFDDIGWNSLVAYNDTVFGLRVTKSTCHVRYQYSIITRFLTCCVILRFDLLWTISSYVICKKLLIAADPENSQRP